METLFQGPRKQQKITFFSNFFKLFFKAPLFKKNYNTNMIAFENKIILKDGTFIDGLKVVFV